jgi:hypothetical protein
MRLYNGNYQPPNIVPIQPPFNHGGFQNQGGHQQNIGQSNNPQFYGQSFQPSFPGQTMQNNSLFGVNPNLGMPNNNQANQGGFQNNFNTFNQGRK